MLTPEEIIYVVKDCGARVILAPPAKGTPILDLRRDSSLEHIVIFGDEVPAGARSFNRLLEEGAPTSDDVDSPPDSLSTICYTSTTFGYPKGVVLSHRTVVLDSAMTANMHVRTAPDTVVTALPCAHVYGNVIMNSAFMYGVTLVLLERFSEAEILQAIQTVLGSGQLGHLLLSVLLCCEPLGIELLGRQVAERLVWPHRLVDGVPRRQRRGYYRQVVREVRHLILTAAGGGYGTLTA